MESKHLHIGTIHRKGESFADNDHLKQHFKTILYLDDDSSCAERNMIYHYDNGVLKTERYGNKKDRLVKYNRIVEMLKDTGCTLVHDEFFYSVYEEVGSNKGVSITDNDLHESLIKSIIEQSVKDEESTYYFALVDDVVDNMYVIHSICVEDAIHGDMW